MLTGIALTVICAALTVIIVVIHAIYASRHGYHGTLTLLFPAKLRRKG